MSGPKMVAPKKERVNSIVMEVTNSMCSERSDSTLVDAVKTKPHESCFRNNPRVAGDANLGGV